MKLLQSRRYIIKLALSMRTSVIILLANDVSHVGVISGICSHTNVVQMKPLDALATLESRLEDIIVSVASIPAELLTSQEHNREKKRRQVKSSQDDHSHGITQYMLNMHI